ncbi:MAG TPA: metal-dependent hydrolase [Chthoniobacter sp.]|nr:metal-dependent hydrolase [Chthoniobacter sp.]
MHVQTHLMSGWCAADLLDLTPRERLFAMIAAAVADLDGLGVVVSVDYYVAYHHLLGHNFLFGIIASGILTIFSTHRLKAFCLYLALFHLHLVLDLLGSGPEWGIHYLWPFSSAEIQNPRGWELFSWQNFCAAALLLAWTFVIAIRHKRTPLEVIAPSLDQKLVHILRRRFEIAK